MSSITISEIFGPTLQGEGDVIGMPSVFIRTGGCDFRCRWCDTPHAVLPEHAHKWCKMSPEAIMAQVIQLAKPPILITLSGGNPALQPCEPLLQLGVQQGYRFALETQATVAHTWFALLHTLTISPKPPSAQVSFSDAALRACVAYQTKGVVVNIKCAIFDAQDYQWAKALAKQHPDVPFFLQPVGMRGDSLQQRIERFHWLVEHTLQDKWYQVRVLPQLHTLLWGDALGV